MPLNQRRQLTPRASARSRRRPRVRRGPRQPLLLLDRAQHPSTHLHERAAPPRTWNEVPPAIARRGRSLLGEHHHRRPPAGSARARRLQEIVMLSTGLPQPRSPPNLLARARRGSIFTCAARLRAELGYEARLTRGFFWRRSPGAPLRRRPQHVVKSGAGKPQAALASTCLCRRGRPGAASHVSKPAECRSSAAGALRRAAAGGGVRNEWRPRTMRGPRSAGERCRERPAGRVGRGRPRWGRPPPGRPDRDPGAAGGAGPGPPPRSRGPVPHSG